MAIMSTDHILGELALMAKDCHDVTQLLEAADDYINGLGLSEAQIDAISSHLRFDLLDIDRFVTVNSCKEITDVRAFDRDNIPSDGGLLSYKIFGTTNTERAGIYAYIDLHGTYMNPCYYKLWSTLDSKVKNIVMGIKYYSIDENGLFIEDPEHGETGIDFIVKNIKKIQFKPTESVSRSLILRFLNQNRNNMFITKYLVIPCFYRDKNTEGTGKVGLGGVNKLYQNLQLAVNYSLEMQDFGFDAGDAARGRIQITLLNIYDWFCGNNNKAIEDIKGTGISGKFGILRRANLSKTANFSSRLVISAPELKAKNPQSMKVDFDKSAIPMYAAISQFRDFVMFHVRRFFENEFVGSETYPVQTKDGVIKYIVPDAPEIYFSDDRIKREMERFLHGYNNRFVPIEIPVKGTNEKYYMAFKGSGVQPIERTENPEQIYQRRLTWCDIFYIATVEATRNRQVLITRFPINNISVA